MAKVKFFSNSWKECSWSIG